MNTASEVKEQRGHPRIACDLLDSDHQMIRNMSKGGAYIESEKEYKPTDKLILSFVNNKTKPIRIPAKIVRRTSLSLNRYGYGIHFEQLSDVAQQDLEHFLKTADQIPGKKIEFSGNRKDCYRPVRYVSDQFKECTFHATVKNADVYLINFSQFGARFACNDHSFSMHKDQILPEFCIRVEGEEIFNGRVRVKNTLKKENSIEYGVAFLNKDLNEEQIIRIQREKHIKKELSTFLQNVHFVDEVDFSFKLAVTDLRHFLEEMKRNLLIAEDSIKDLSLEQQNELKSRLMNFYEKILRDEFNQFATKIYHIFKDLPTDRYSIYKKYFQKELLSYTNDSIIFDRSIKKPRGYSGDYIMMDIIYRNNRAGNTLWESLINSCIVSIPPGEALRNRVKYVLGQIRMTVEKVKATPVRILSIACGPCEEIRQYLSENANHERHIEFYLIDQDEESLKFAQKDLYQFSLEPSSNVSFRLINDSVKNFLKNPNNSLSYPKFDLIYAAGLFDYLKDEVARSLSKILFSMLNKDGRLIIGNASLENYFAFFIEYAAEWYLFHRGKNELKMLVPPEANINKIHIDTDDTGVVHFLNIDL